jgi:small subunit ribosomal protein S17
MTMADTENMRGLRKERTGVVLSAAMNKTIVVQVERKVRHPLYGKEMRQIHKFYAHDEDNTAKTGDKVLISETRPLSKLKRWRLVRILEAAKGQVAG